MELGISPSCIVQIENTMNHNEKRSVIAGLYGNTLEWYDFLLYASFAPIFASLYFPSHLPFVSLLATFAVFAIGFLMRPLGGLILGHYADRVGRRKALIISVIIMTCSTLGIALLPIYQSAGIIAPILFIIFRLIQGLAVGGELPGSTTFLIEHMAKNRRGFAGSLALGTAFLGIFLGSLVAAILSSSLSSEHLNQWGWRLAYLLGGLFGLLGIYLRIHSVESSLFLQSEASKELAAKLVFTHYWRKLIPAVIFTSLMAIGNYILIAYTTTYLVKEAGFLLKDALTINFLALLTMTVLIPFFGLLSDLVGRKPVFLSGVVGLLVLAIPLFWLLSSGSWWLVLTSELAFALLLSPMNATVPTILAEMFPTPIRASGLSIGYNIGQAFFGGTVPLVALGLVQLTGNNLAPAYYVVIWAMLVIFAARYTEETSKDALLASLTDK